jgi:hypothetical protein
MNKSTPRSRSSFLDCPSCERGTLRPPAHDSMRCDFCSGSLSGAMLQVFRQITELPDAIGAHACECGHPQMRLLPDGTRHCPSCGLEVVPIDAHPTLSEHGEAWWAGWMDGHFGERASSVDNSNLARRVNPSERLEYYHGHRAGSEARETTKVRSLMPAKNSSDEEVHGEPCVQSEKGRFGMKDR